jgi:hypothetical protein
MHPQGTANLLAKALELKATQPFLDPLNLPAFQQCNQTFRYDWLADAAGVTDALSFTESHVCMMFCQQQGCMSSSKVSHCTSTAA